MRRLTGAIRDPQKRKPSVRTYSARTVFVKQFSTPLWKTYAFFAWGTENRLTE